MEEKAAKYSKRVITITVIISVSAVLLIIACTVLLVCEINVEPRISIEGTSLIIKDTYSKTVQLNGSVVTLGEGTLPLAKRTGGTSVRNVRKGSFTLESGEAVYLSITNYGGKYIKIIQADGFSLYIGKKDDAATEALYRDILKVGGVTAEDNKTDEYKICFNQNGSLCRVFGT